MRRVRYVLVGFALPLLACNGDPADGNPGGADEPVPCSGCALVSGAVAQGDVIPDFSFTGFVNAQVDAKTTQSISLYDFANPHVDDASYHPESPSVDDRLFPPGSPYGAGTKKPRALLIDIASVWCGPCNEEAKSVLNGLYARYEPCGGEFLFQLAEGAAPGAPVTEQLLQTWITDYKVAYPSVWDPAKQLFPLYNSDSFPDSAIVDTRTMKIIDVISGVADATFWSTYEGLLDAQCLAAGP